MKRYCISFISALVAVSAASAQEQDLSKEITVERDFVPVEQKVTKSNVLPEVYKPQVDADAGAISYSDWAVPVEVPPMAVTLSPYNYGSKYDFSTNRGYFEFGIGTCLNMLGSAGYRLIDMESSKLNIWLQHNSTWVGENRSVNSPYAIDQQWNDNVVGIDFVNHFKAGSLSINAFYHYDNFNYFGRMLDYWPGVDSMQSVNEAHIDLGWTGKFQETEGLNYSFHVKYNYFGFSNDAISPVQGNSENHLKVMFNSDYASSKVSHVGVDMSFDFVNYNLHHYYSVNDSSSVGNENKGIFSIMPYYAYRNGRLNFKAGVRLDVSFNDGTALRFAPHAEFSYELLRGLQFYATASGGKDVNTLSGMFADNRYVSPRLVPVNSYTPLDVVGGFKVGPFGGFNASIYGGWAKVNDVMMPTLENVAGSAYNPVNTYNRSISNYGVLDMKGWRVGGEMAYSFRTLADASIQLCYSPQDGNKGYVMGDDRSSLVFNARVIMRPMKNLAIVLGYQYRGDRAVIFADGNGAWWEQDLQDVSYLKLGANYRLNSIVGFFMDFDNILNKRWDTHYGMGAQPIGILGGVSLLF